MTDKTQERKKGSFISDSFGDKHLSGRSTEWKNWECQFLPNTCLFCMKLHGKIFPFYYIEAPDHDNGQCILVPMRTKPAGTATNNGPIGVDTILKYTGCLPDNYLTKKEAKQNGWIPTLGNLVDVLPGVQIGGDIYKNRDGKLPSKEGRIWYEADFDYMSGYRNDCRILYSSDGLLFVSYDHYKTFHEIT